MKLHGTIDVHVTGEPVLRAPGLLDRLKRALGGTPDLSTNRVKASIEAAAIVDAVQVALRSLAITNAISLVIDDSVVFEDRKGRPDDLGDLLIAFNDQSGVFGQGFRLLRLAAEHEESGLHLVIEVVARTEHPAEEPAVRVVVSGRMRALEPLLAESAEAYRLRVEPLSRDAAAVRVHRVQFESFVDRVAHAVRTAMPGARVEVRWAEARIDRPARRGRGVAVREAKAKELPPTSPQYDPYLRYYPSPYSGMLSMMMWGWMVGELMTPDVVVIGDDGVPVGHASEVGAQGEGDADGDGDGNGNGDGDGDGNGNGNGDGDGDGDVDQGDGGGDFDGGDFDGGGFDGGFDM